MEGGLDNPRHTKGLRSISCPLGKGAVSTFALALTLVSNAAIAQDTVGSDAPDAGQSTEIDKETGGAIVVTANRREQMMQDVAGGVSSLNVDEFISRGLINLEDILDYTPGVTFIDSGAPGSGSLTIRGIPQTGSVPTASVYLDDVPVSTNSAFAGGGSNFFDGVLNDIERVEVVRGPQGTLYGSVAVGGLVKYVTRRPSLDGFRASGTAQLSTMRGGDINQLYSGRVSAAVVENVLGLTVSGFFEDNSGYLDLVNPATREVINKNVNGYERWGVSGDLLLQLSDVTDIRLKGQYQDTSRTNNSLQTIAAAGGEEAQFGRFGTIAQPGDLSLVYQTYSGTLAHEFDFAKFTSVSAYSKYKNVSRGDISPTFAVPVFPNGASVADFLLGLDPGSVTQVFFVGATQSEKFVQELRLASNANETFEWQGGVYFTEERTKNFQEGPVAPANLGRLIFIDFPSKYTELAGYASGTVYLAPEFDLTGGLRVSRTSIGFSTESSGPLLGLGEPPVVEQFATERETVATWNVEGRYRPSANLSLYAKAGTGYRPASAVVPLVDPLTGNPLADTLLDRDDLLAFEIGAKGSSADGKFYYETAIWHSIYDNFQTTVGTVGIATEGNFNGKLRSTGFEAQVVAKPIDGLQLIGNITYTDSNLRGNDPVVGIVSGDRAVGVPEWTGSAAANYSTAIFDQTFLDFGAGARYRGAAVTGYQVRNAGGRQLEVDPYLLVDANIGVRFNSFNISLFVKNLFDNDSLESRNDTVAGTVNALFTTPRTVGVTFSVAM
jgi:outer membrane receptor protein involved in Fe transport